jgi:hypothetical protein
MSFLTSQRRSRVNKYQLDFENDPKLRWVLQEDPLLSKSLIDVFLI